MPAPRHLLALVAACALAVAPAAAQLDSAALRALVAEADSLSESDDILAAVPLFSRVARSFDPAASVDVAPANARALADSAAYYRFRAAGAYAQLWRGDEAADHVRDSLAPVAARGSDFARGLLAYMETEVLWVRSDWRALREPAHRAIALLSAYGGKGPGYVAQTQQKLAFTMMSTDPDSARYYAALSLRTLQDRYAPCSDWVGHGYNSAATVYSYSGDIPGAVELYQLARNVYRETLGPRHRITALADKNLAQAYYELADLAAALAHVERAIDVFEDLPPDYYYSSACEYYGLILGQLGDHEGARRWIERALAIDRAVAEGGGSDASVNSTWRQVAMFAYDDGDPAAAYAALDSADAAAGRFLASVEGDTDFDLESGHMRAMLRYSDAERERALGASPDYGPVVDSFEAAFARITRDTVYNYLAEARLLYGGALVRDGRVGDGIAAARGAAHRLTSRSGGSHHAYATALATLAELYVLAGQPDSARAYATRALDAVGIGVAPERSRHAPITPTTPEIAAIYLAVYGLDTAAAQTSVPYGTEAVADFVLDYLGRAAAQLPRLRYRPDELTEVRSVMAAAARAAAARGDFDRALAYLAVPRAMSLRRRSAAAAAAHAAALPEAVRVRDHDLRLALAAARALPDSHARRGEALAEADFALREHEFELRRDFPGYYRLVRSPLGRPPATPAPPPGNARVRYLVDDTRATLLASLEVAGQPGRLLELPFDSPTAAAVDRVARAQVDPTQAFPLADAHRVYEALVAPLCLGFDAGVERLAIAADGPLLGLSFAALLTEPARAPGGATLPGDAPWLASAVDLHYEDFADDFAGDVAAARGGLLAVAPAFDEALAEQLAAAGEALPAEGLPLRTPWSLALADELAEAYDADVLRRAEATEGAVRARFADYAVLHFATHAVLDDEDAAASYFALAPGGDSAADGRLSAYELYDANVPARLAVLANCHSGAGEVVPGDGVYSLATGLRSAGCAAVVQSLWAVDDEQTNALLADLYRGLGAGRRLDASLQDAQATFLAEAPPELRHPYYWAGLTVRGDAGPVDLRGGGPRPWWWWGLGGAAAAVAAAGGIARRRATLPA